MSTMICFTLASLLCEPLVGPIGRSEDEQNDEPMVPLDIVHVVTSR